MFKKIYWFLSTILLFVGSYNSLSQDRKCATMQVLQKQIEQNPALKQRMSSIETFTDQCLKRGSFKNARLDGPITIPVVVHILYQTEEQNISEAQVFSQIDVLNKDFRRLNTDADNTWEQASDTQIEFCMATVDPNGNPTNGITRKFIDRSSWGTNDAMKNSLQGGVNAWATTDYLNMWVCNIGGGVLGYAQFPGGDINTDGVVISPQFFGTTGLAQPPFNGGRTTTHEVGHWLNLRHIWGDGGCSIDDFVSDTPASDAPNYGCATSHVSCGSSDMVQNYMDYSDDACMNLFTEGQKTRMRALFDTDGFRESLLNANGCSGDVNPVVSCNDGIQNQGETDIDCGGPCEACSTTCTDTEISVSIKFDNYPEETSWEITNEAGNVVVSGGPYNNEADGSTLNITECLTDACYNFTIKDAYSDGMCCSFGNGAYSVSVKGNVVASGASFTDLETTNFCIGAPLATCEDGIQNQDETGVDCGGPCEACPTCNDGTLNQDETGVDCGGTCPPCTNNCTAINLTINFDNYPEETAWTIINASGNIIAEGGPYSSQQDGSSLNIDECLPNGCYNFTITDVYADGICCAYGNGSYILTTAEGNTLATGGSFTDAEGSAFCFDELQSGACTETLIDEEDFESGWGIWNDGGGDSYRNNYAPYASSGTYTIRIRDNSSSSFMTSDALNLTNYEELTVAFSYYPVELEDGEDFWLQLSTDGGNTYTTIKTWVKGVDFDNNSSYQESVTINQAFSANTKIRFRVDASVNNDRVYFDDVIITACGIGN